MDKRYYGGADSNGHSDDSPGPIPDRWLLCPRNATEFIAQRFLAFKTPLGSRYASQMSPEYHFPPSMVFSYMKIEKKKLGLWIDLTYTTRFYDRSEVEARECQYRKLKCRGHGETPSEEQTQAFIEIVDEFIANRPLEYVGVHCTHGFNRTGFLIVSYMVEKMDCSVEAAILAFADARPPGIYKQDYINELFRRYEDVEDAIPAPERPTWCLDYDDSDRQSSVSHKRPHDDGYAQNGYNGTNEPETGNFDDESAVNGESSTSTESVPKKKRRKEFLNLNATFMAGIQGVELVTDQPRLGDLQEKIHHLCRFEGRGFPGSQPVSMDMKNIALLQEKPYRVSWKADGTRYMMLILKEHEVYFFDRDNSCFQVTGMRFPCRDDLKTHIYDTLIDGEMVIDKVNGLSVPRFLVYDIVSYNGTNYMENEFHSGTLYSRMQCIKENIVDPRRDAMLRGMIIKDREPFSVRMKEFWDIDNARKLLEPKFTRTLGHEPDGLIFQPSKDPYTCGQCNVVLKWKPLSMNSVDFKLKIGTESGAGILQKKIGILYVGGYEAPFSQIKMTKELKSLDGKIIECKFEDNKWVFMRERTDKSFPNSYNTALAVCQSIKNPVTTEYLIDYIERFRYDRMMPPPRLPRQY